MRKLLTATLALAALSLMATTVLSADKKVLAIVVKGLDNPFFEQINLGQKWNKENASAEYERRWGPHRAPTKPVKSRSSRIS